jgi:hypothetical protein
MKTYGRMDIYVVLCIIDPDTRVLNVTPRPLNFRGKKPLYLMDRRMGLESVEKRTVA